MIEWSIMANFVAFGALTIAWIGLFFAWGHWRDQIHVGELSTQRRVSINVALFAVTMQALLFIALWTPFSRHHRLVMECVRGDLVLALATIPCVVAWRGRASALAELAY
jgi:hypothetical protein